MPRSRSAQQGESTSAEPIPARLLAAAGEEERAEALARFGVLRPHLEEGVPLTRAAQQAGVEDSSRANPDACTNG